MNASTAQLILLGLTLAEKVMFQVGPKLIEINTTDFTDPAEIVRAFDEARAEGFPDLKFISTAEAP